MCSPTRRIVALLIASSVLMMSVEGIQEPFTFAPQLAHPSEHALRAHHVIFPLVPAAESSRFSRQQ
jgi:hypothetical protein